MKIIRSWKKYICNKKEEKYMFMCGYVYEKVCKIKKYRWKEYYDNYYIILRVYFSL